MPEGLTITEIQPSKIYDGLANAFGFHYFNSLSVSPAGTDEDYRTNYVARRYDVHEGPQWFAVPRDMTLHPRTGKKATQCDLCGLREHRPLPFRFVWHHILPQVCGGLSKDDNLVQTCDTGHYNTHILMWLMANGRDAEASKLHATRGQRVHAARGITLAAAAGTLLKMPKEAAA